MGGALRIPRSKPGEQLGMTTPQGLLGRSGSSKLRSLRFRALGLGCRASGSEDPSVVDSTPSICGIQGSSCMLGMTIAWGGPRSREVAFWSMI